MAATVNEARLRLTAEDDTGRGMASAAKNMRRTADEAERQSRRVEAAARRQGAAIGNTVGAIGGALGGAAAAKVVKDSYVEFANADRALSRIGNTAGKTSAQMQGVGVKLNSIADKFALPINTVTEGLEALTSAGRSLDESLDFLPSVAAAAQASGAGIQDIASSANALATSMGFTGAQMEHVFDVLVAGGQAGNFELKDMARYLPQLAPMAAAVGYKGEEGLKKLVAILQVVRKQTGDAGQAADATREVFGKMNSEELNNAFKELGNYDLKGTMEAAAKAGKDLPSTFVGFTRDVLNAAANGADPLLKLPNLFKDQQLQNGMRALLSQPGAVKELVAQLGKVDGTTLRNLKNVTEDAAAAATRLENSYKGIERAIGEVLSAAHAPEGLQWMAAQLDRSAEGFKRIARLGFGGAVGRAAAKESVEGLEGDLADKAKEVDGASSPGERARLQAEQREIEERLQLARDRFTRADKADPIAKDGFPAVPDLPPILPPELQPPAAKPLSVEPGFRNPYGPARPGFADPRELMGGTFQPTSFSVETAQEDTQKGMARDIAAMKSVLTRAIGPNAPSGRFGGMLQRASLGGEGSGDAVGAGYGGSGVSVTDSGGVGGTAGAPNMRYGGQSAVRGGSGGSPGASGRTGGGGVSGGSAPQGTGKGTRGAARTGEMMRVAMDQLKREGVPDAELRKSAAHLVGQATMESGLDPNKSHDGGTGYGLYGARDPSPGRGRRSDMLNWMKANGYPANSAEGQMRFMAKEAMSGKYGKTKSILMGNGSGNLDADTNAITGEFERPKYINKRSGAVAGALAIGPQDAGTGESAGEASAGGGPDGGPLRVKGGMNGQAFAGGETRPGTIAAARDFQRDGLPGGVSHFSAFNDRYHAGTSSKHASGLAFDTTLKENTREAYAAAKIAAEERLRKAGLGEKDFRVIDEKNNPSARATGAHLHTQFNSPEAAAQYNAWSAKEAEARAIAEKAKDAEKAQAQAPAAPAREAQGPQPAPSIEQGGTGFRARAPEPEAPTPVQSERVRERPPSQARRELDRDVRSARLNTYSDVGVA